MFVLGVFLAWSLVLFFPEILRLNDEEERRIQFRELHHAITANKKHRNRKMECKTQTICKVSSNQKCDNFLFSFKKKERHERNKPSKPHPADYNIEQT